jgi:signal transduction histidine kinase
MDNVYGINIIPDNDAERVAALQRYQILNTHRETAFDSICELACEIFSCPISHISFLDADTEFIKAGVGVDGIERVSRGVGFCSVAILNPEIMLIEDTHTHKLFTNHPYVTGELKIRFYAAAPVITPDGYVIGAICIIDTQPRSMTEKEQQLLLKLGKVVMEQIELRFNNISLLQQRDKFITIASHEMRTPLTALKGAIQILHDRSDKISQEVNNRLMDQANKSVNKLSNLVNDLFEASRLAEKDFGLERTSFKLRTLIEGATDFIKITGKYELRIEGDADLQVVADEQKIEQVIVNLVENAVKYAPNSPVIYIDIDKIPGFVKVQVTDKGPGIAPGKLPHIFRRYFSSEPGNIQAGLGLGLYICAEIIKQHGGDIGVETELNKGSTFWFTLPIG